MSRRPAQEQLILPLLESLQERGGRASPREVYDAVAARVGLDAPARQARARVGASETDCNLFERHVRWARQKAVLRGWVDGQTRNVWALTDEGRDSLRNAKPGVVLTVYETDLGVCLWAECEAATALITSGTVNLILTSPPYPLLARKDYANQHEERQHVTWLARCVEQWARILTEDGSLLLNLGDTFLKGQPAMSLWQERLVLELVDRLGLHLAQKLFWENPSKMPAPAAWVTVRRVRVTPSVEQVWWLSKTPHPKANSRRVLRPYSQDMKRLLERGATPRVRPSGHVIRAGAFSADNGGSIPHSLLVAGNSKSWDAYQRACCEQGLPVHPARFPEALAEFGIQLTTEAGDLVCDPFAGSNTVGATAERLGRRWLSVEKSLTYALGSMNRFGGYEVTSYAERLGAPPSTCTSTSKGRA